MSKRVAGLVTLNKRGRRYRATIGFLSKLLDHTPVGSIDMFNASPELIATTNAPPLARAFYSASISNVVQEAENSRSFEFAFQDFSKLPVRAGQFVPVRFRIGNDIHERCYAISSLVARGDTPRITIKRVEGGLVSNWCNESLTRGTPIWVGQPAGSFRVRPDNSPLVFMAGGIGLAPIYPMLKETLLCGTRSVALMIFDREQSAVPFLGALQAFTQQFKTRLQIMETYVGKDGTASAASMQRQLQGLSDASLYMCGPSGFMQTAEIAGLAAGIPSSRIFMNSQADISERLQVS